MPLDGTLPGARPGPFITAPPSGARAPILAGSPIGARDRFTTTPGALDVSFGGAQFFVTFPSFEIAQCGAGERASKTTLLSLLGLVPTGVCANALETTSAHKGMP